MNPKQGFRSFVAFFIWGDVLNIEKTKSFYKKIKSDELCNCAYCQNYFREIKASYPTLTEYLNNLGIDIEKPFETMPLEPDESGYIEYICAQYIVCGTPDDFVKETVGLVKVDIAESHPSTAIEENHFLIEVYPIRLKWVM